MKYVTLPIWPVGDTVNYSFVDEWEKTGFIFTGVGGKSTSSVNTEKKIKIMWYKTLYLFFILYSHWGKERIRFIKITERKAEIMDYIVLYMFSVHCICF